MQSHWDENLSYLRPSIRSREIWMIAQTRTSYYVSDAASRYGFATLKRIAL